MHSSLSLSLSFLACPQSKSQSSPSPSRTPAAPLRSRDCIGRRIQLSRPAALLQDPLRSSAPSPLAPAPAALCGAAQQVGSAIASTPGPAPSGGRVVLEDMLLAVELAAGSRGPCWVCLSALLPRPGSSPKHLLSSPLRPGDQGSRPHLFGACDSMPFPSSPLLLFQPAHSRPVPSLSSRPLSELRAGCCLASGLLLSHQGLLTI